jgi:hypothetical protein
LSCNKTRLIAAAVHLVIVCLVQPAWATLALEILPDGSTPAPGPFTNTAGNWVNRLNVTFDNKIGANQLLIQLTQGAMILDSLLPGSSASDVSTFVTMGGTTLGTSDPISLAGAATSLGSVASSLTYSATLLDVTWFTNPTPSTGGPGYLLAQIVLTPDALGTWSFLGTSSDGNDAVVHTGPASSTNPIGRGVISGGIMSVVPEPSAMWYLALTTLSVSGCAFTARLRKFPHDER